MMSCFLKAASCSCSKVLISSSYYELWLLVTKWSNSVAYLQEMGIATESPFSLPENTVTDSIIPCPITCSRWLSNFFFFDFQTFIVLFF